MGCSWCYYLGWIGFIAWAAYAVFIVRFLHNLYHRKLLYLREMDPNMQAKYQATSRYDISNLNEYKLYLGGMFLLPFRVIRALPLLIILYILVWIPKLIFNVNLKNNQEPRGKFYLKWVTGVFVMIKPLLYLLGMQGLWYRKVRINDYIASYKPKQDTKVAPVVVSNHSSWMDMFYFMNKNVSFLAKDSVATTPYIGMFAIARQCIFVDRSNEADRQRVIEAIHTKVERVMSHGDVSPILIFPEGTVANGRTLMRFKRGAFASKHPIKIYVLRYNPGGNQIVNTISNISDYYSLILFLCQFRNTLEVIEFEDNFDPLWAFEKHKVDPNSPESWTVVAQEVKELMMVASGYQSVETSSEETKDFYKQCLEYNKQLLQKKVV